MRYRGTVEQVRRGGMIPGPPGPDRCATEGHAWTVRNNGVSTGRPYCSRCGERR